MPISEKICYCGGPIIRETFGPDKKCFYDSYVNRKVLYRVKNSRGPE
jgi:hypothetical protein